MTHDNKKGKSDLPTSIEQSEVSKAVEKSYKKYANGFQRPSVLLNLEPRMMFDGAAPAVVDDILESTGSANNEALPNPNTEPPSNEANESSGQEEQGGGSSQADENIAASESLFDQLTNNTLSDPAADLESTEDEYENEEILESTLDDLSVNTEEDTEGSSQESVSEAPPALALNDNAAIQQEPQDNSDEQPVIDYTEKGDIDRVVFFDTTVNGYEDLLEGLINDLQNPEAESLNSNEINAVDLESALETAAENDNTLYVNGVAIHLLK